MSNHNWFLGFSLQDISRLAHWLLGCRGSRGPEECLLYCHWVCFFFENSPTVVAINSYKWNFNDVQFIGHKCTVLARNSNYFYGCKWSSHSIDYVFFHWFRTGILGHNCRGWVNRGQETRNEMEAVQNHGRRLYGIILPKLLGNYHIPLWES